MGHRLIGCLVCTSRIPTQGGIVYYASYLKFIERARTEWLRGHKIDVERIAREDHALFAVRSLKLDYRQPLIIPDTILTEL